jgi:hypothetical protein
MNKLKISETNVKDYLSAADHIRQLFKHINLI